MIDKLKNWSEHVSDEAVTTSQLLNDASDVLTEAKGHIEKLIEEYGKVLRAYGFSGSTDSIIAAREFITNGKLI